MLMKILVESAADSDKYLSDDIRIMEDMVNNKAILSNYVILIDAYDECKSKSDRVQLINTIVDDIREVGMKVVVTCRNSHRDELITMIDEIGGIEQFTELDITFTPHDLQFEMPMKLANAWGISGEQISYEVGYRFNQFKEVLTHPLFVGLFCLLLQKGEIDKIDTTSSTALSLKGDIGVAHVQFLRKIIDIGLEINISDRTKEFDSAKIKMAFKHIAALNHLFAIEDFTLLIEALENSCGIILSADEIEILQNNLGIMYATDGNTLEWSHKTLSEVATGILLAETDYNIVSNTYSLNWRGFVSKGERGSILTKSWSECLILTIALISSESSKTKLVQSIINTLPKFGENSLHTIEMLYPKNAPTPLLFTCLLYTSPSPRD